MHIVVLRNGHGEPAPALLEALRGAGLSASFDAGADAGGGGAGAPSAVICEVDDGADVLEVHAAVARASDAWPLAPLVACRRAAAPGRPAEGRWLDAAALARVGFRAVADNPAQVPALLRELEASGDEAGDSTAAQDAAAAPVPGSLLLPESLGVPVLRAAFEVVASLHLVSDQRGAAQTALAGLAPLVPADRWTLYLTEAEKGARDARFEPLAARGRITCGEDGAGERRVLPPDALLALTGSESRAAREAHAAAEPVSKIEDGRAVLAVPLVCGERVAGVVEVVREGDTPHCFEARDASLLSALAVPVSAALANSARIAEAERLSLTDDLTKLHNARFLRQFLTSEIKRARRYGSQVAALFLDLDDFKEINDRHGHLAGSHLLMEMATVILTGVRDTDIVSRYGGDEFVVVLPETGTDMAERVAERVREKIATHTFTGGRNLSLRITASFGISCFPQHAQSPQQLVAMADAAMYEAKSARKNCVRFAPGPAV